MTVSPPRWRLDQFEGGVARAIDVFRDERMSEAREDYASHFYEAQGAVEELLELTADLTQLRTSGHAALTRHYEATRYLTAPPTSDDDLQTLSGVSKRNQGTAAGSQSTIDTIIALIDNHRFPWLFDGCQPSEGEKRVAVVATAVQIAARRILTARANESKVAQGNLVKHALEQSGLSEVESRVINTMRSAPSPGQFCGKSMLGSRKADIVVGLWDERALAIECKVSNSAVNSVKRIKNEAGSKAVRWLAAFGTQLIVPAAVIAGVYHAPNLLSAQNDGLTIWWSHEIEHMIDWITKTRK